MTSIQNGRSLIVSLHSHTSPNSVFSMRPLTALASSASLSFMSCADMIGVLIEREALMISLIRGTPRVISNTVQKTIQYTEISHKMCQYNPELEKRSNRKNIGEKELSASLIHRFPYFDQRRNTKQNIPTCARLEGKFLMLRSHCVTTRVYSEFRENKCILPLFFPLVTRLLICIHHQWI